MEDHSKQRNKPSTKVGYQKCIKRNIIPILGHMKVQDVKRPDIAGAMKKMAHKTVAMFMRYVHIEDKPVREAA